MIDEIAVDLTQACKIDNVAAGHVVVGEKLTILSSESIDNWESIVVSSLIEQLKLKYTDELWDELIDAVSERMTLGMSYVVHRSMEFDISLENEPIRPAILATHATKIAEDVARGLKIYYHLALAGDLLAEAAIKQIVLDKINQTLDVVEGA